MSGSVPVAPTTLSPAGDTSSPVGGFVPQYLTDDTKILSGISVNSNVSPFPSTLTINVTPSGGDIATIYVSTPGFGHNAFPFSANANGASIILDFGSNTIYREYVVTGAVFFLSVKWQ
jgi:hypothetical protein